jgi:hypothetical protein
MNVPEVQKLIQTATKKIRIRRDGLSKCMIDQPSLYLEFAQELVKGKAREKAIKTAMEGREGYQHRMLAEKEKRPSVAAVMAKCWKDRKWKEMRTELDEVTTVVYALELICKALEHRRDMLINVGATVREEMRSLGTHTSKKGSG